MNRCRAVYTKGHEWFVAQLSGIAISEPYDHQYPITVAPVDPTNDPPSNSSSASSDDDGSPEEIAIMAMCPFYINILHGKLVGLVLFGRRATSHSLSLGDFSFMRFAGSYSIGPVIRRGFLFGS